MRIMHRDDQRRSGSFVRHSGQRRRRFGDHNSRRTGNRREASSAIQQAFIDNQALQCGFCVNGVIMTAKAYLDKNARASDADIRQALSGVLCRCGTHTRMMQALRQYAQGGRR